MEHFLSALEPEGLLIITGAALGVEEAVREIAPDYGLGVRVYGGKQTYKRYSNIIHDADMTIVFWDEESKGVPAAIDRAISSETLLAIVYPTFVDIQGRQIPSPELALTSLATGINLAHAGS